MERAFQYLLALLCLVSLAAADLCSYGQRFSFFLFLVERIARLIYVILESRSTNPPRMDGGATNFFERKATAAVIFNLQVSTLLRANRFKGLPGRRPRFFLFATRRL